MAKAAWLELANSWLRSLSSLPATKKFWFTNAINHVQTQTALNKQISQSPYSCGQFDAFPVLPTKFPAAQSVRNAVVHALNVYRSKLEFTSCSHQLQLPEATLQGRAECSVCIEHSHWSFVVTLNHNSQPPPQLPPHFGSHNHSQHLKGVYVQIPAGNALWKMYIEIILLRRKPCPTVLLTGIRCHHLIWRRPLLPWHHWHPVVLGKKHPPPQQNSPDAFRYLDLPDRQTFPTGRPRKNSSTLDMNNSAGLAQAAMKASFKPDFGSPLSWPSARPTSRPTFFCIHPLAPWTLPALISQCRTAHSKNTISVLRLTDLCSASTAPINLNVAFRVTKQYSACSHT